MFSTHSSVTLAALQKLTRPVTWQRYICPAHTRTHTPLGSKSSDSLWLCVQRFLCVGAPWTASTLQSLGGEHTSDVLACSLPFFYAHHGWMGTGVSQWLLPHSHSKETTMNTQGIFWWQKPKSPTNLREDITDLMSGRHAFTHNTHTHTHTHTHTDRHAQTRAHVHTYPNVRYCT